MRLIEALKQNFPHLSQKQMRDLIKAKQVLWRGRAAKISDDIARPDELSIPATFLQTALQPNPDLQIQILFEDEDFLFVEKPANMHSVAQSFAELNSVANAILNTHPEQIALHPLECGLAHRLDFETTGVMVAAKNATAYEFLRHSFQNAQIEKIYMAVTAKRAPRLGLYRACVVDGAKSAKRIHLTSEQINDKVLETEILDAKASGTDFIITLKLVTGHRHQIRAQLALLDCPLKGDTLYGDLHEPPFQLHAQSLAFFYNGKTYYVESV